MNTLAMKNELMSIKFLKLNIYNLEKMETNTGLCCRNGSASKLIGYRMSLKPNTLIVFHLMKT